MSERLINILFALLLIIAGATLLPDWHFWRLAGPTVMDGKPIAILASQQDDVRHRSAQSVSWYAATEKDLLLGRGDSIFTGHGSSATIRFRDSDAEIQMGQDSLVIVSVEAGAPALIVKGGRVKASTHGSQLRMRGSKSGSTVRVQENSEVSLEDSTNSGATVVKTEKGPEVIRESEDLPEAVAPAFLTEKPKATVVAAVPTAVPTPLPPKAPSPPPAPTLNPTTAPTPVDKVEEKVVARCTGKVTNPRIEHSRNGTPPKVSVDVRGTWTEGECQITIACRDACTVEPIQLKGPQGKRTIALPSYGEFRMSIEPIGSIDATAPGPKASSSLALGIKVQPRLPAIVEPAQGLRVSRQPYRIRFRVTPNIEVTTTTIEVFSAPQMKNPIFKATLDRSKSAIFSPKKAGTYWWKMSARRDGVEVLGPTRNFVVVPTGKSAPKPKSKGNLLWEGGK